MTVVKIVPMPGVPGTKGDKGNTGNQGIQGENGLPGASAYQIAVGYGFSGNESSWINSLKGNKGDTGDKGDQGNTGLTGASAYQLAISNGFSGSEQDWLNSLVGGQPSRQSYDVSGGTDRTQPVFDGTPLFQGSFVSLGDLVHFCISVDMSNIVDFGSGQYFVSLPYNAFQDVLLRDGHFHDASANKTYYISGHVSSGTNILKLSYATSNGQESIFTATSPVSLSIEDDFHISGSYIKAGN